MRTLVLPAWTVPGPGTVLADRYVVEAESGRDGLAAVLVGREIDFDRRVVIRVLLPQWADDPRAIDQFRREGRAAARVRGEGLPVAFDGGTLPSGAPYVVLDVPAEPEVEAWPLEARTRESWRPREPDRVVAGGLFMLCALGAAAFMWLYSTVHANEPLDVGVTALQPVENLLDAGVAVDADPLEAGPLAPNAAQNATASFPGALPNSGTDAGTRASGGAESSEWLGPMRVDAGPTVRELRKHLRRVQHVRTDAFDAPETRKIPAPRAETYVPDPGAGAPSATTTATPSTDEVESTSPPDTSAPAAPPVEEHLLDSRQ